MRGRVLQACLPLGNNSTSTSTSINSKLSLLAADILRVGAVEERERELGLGLELA